ncbi:MAG TPA: response regulator transcription factor [Pseudonocardiaceae bacterium]
MRILVVEDDKAVAAALRDMLVARSYGVVRAHTAAQALALFARTGPDLVLLDMGLPDLDGLQLCRTLRASSDVAIIAVTARSEEAARVTGLRAGADDYVVKPFSAPELVARIEAVLRRTRSLATPDVVQAAGVRLDLRDHRATVDGRPVELARKEFELLAALARRGGAVATRAELLEEVWQITWAGSSRTLDQHVAAVRRKLGRPGVIETVHGVGHRLGPP